MQSFGVTRTPRRPSRLGQISYTPDTDDTDEEGMKMATSRLLTETQKRSGSRWVNEVSLTHFLTRTGFVDRVISLSPSTFLHEGVQEPTSGQASDTQELQVQAIRRRRAQIPRGTLSLCHLRSSKKLIIAFINFNCSIACFASSRKKPTHPLSTSNSPCAPYLP